MASEPTNPVALSLSDVTVRYGETTAVEGLSLGVREGEFFTLVGPSGCGKTTPLRLIAGFESPTAGSVAIGGTRVAEVPPEERNVGVVFQNYALFPHMSVAQNVGYGLRFADPPGGVSREKRVADLLDLVDLADAGERSPEELSGGQQQRVAIARALAPGPDVLLLDEPMSALDARLRERLRGQVRSIQRELDITTVYVTHDQEEALAISDRVAVMRAGRVEQIDPPRTVYDAPRTRFVAEFVGDNNVLTGTVVEPSADRSPEPLPVRVGEETLAIAADAIECDRGDRVTFCVRPEDLLPGAETNRLEATVESAEFLGSSTRTRLRWQGRELIARSEARPGDRLRIGFSPEDAHVVSLDADG
ncbi:ABC transporter ATP-binding protein [Halalkalicoccus jeotgali]|uniref:Molybdate/tungstate import ATP-binding protein WtpC n=1 Tax=Halalkalicoccus jeotgali (strain DSM 18796 / CECT 7217 / JCM 14584 / KCTC 4019 / B3) TaxID=795797 RepID=D8J7D7_HALJB|nr:ABC transporter ATP-binding protein [Halalkalicoccus jeotgali]ADJ14032.1 ABC transporter related protein [Halalkalicoccus jeotgali B3]ELY33924.1 ABC transporter-like protein [Halalkalicoccus jeotgali B3]